MASTDEQEKTKITLTGAQETLLLTLYSKSYDHTQAPNPILNDEWSTRVIEKIDYDFSKLGIRSNFCAHVALRAFWLDKWAVEFLDAHKDDPRGATVLHLACGLDCRALRLQHHFGTDPNVRWIDVDVPEVAALRRELVPEPEGDYTLLAADVSDPAWLAQVPDDRPTLVVMEGLSMYLSERDGLALLANLVGRFPRGGQIVFDAFASWAIWLQGYFGPVQRTGARLGWSVDDPEAVARRAHARLRLVDDQLAFQRPGIEKYPWWARVPMWAAGWVPVLKSAGRNLRYEF